MKKQLGKIIGHLFGHRSPTPRQPIRTRSRLHLEQLENRLTPANASGVLTGIAFVDGNQNGSRDSGESVLAGIAVNLVGTTTQGTPVSVSTNTDASGAFTFENLLPGTYQFATENDFLIPGSNTSAPPGERVVSSFVVNGGDTLSIDAAFQGFDPSVISLRSFLNTANVQTNPWGGAGDGTAEGNYRENNAPTLLAGAHVFEFGKDDTVGAADLASVFSDPDITNSRIVFNTSLGSLKVELYDNATPQTVANFFNYINSDRFDSTIFHRLVSGFVLQGGGYDFSANPSQLTPVDTDATIANEFSASRSNLFGTIAMAKVENDPNSATSQFFFNLGNNSANLDAQNGGFTVFGKIIDASDTLVLNNLAAVPTQNKGGDFGTIPLRNYSGANFPTDTTAANYLMINDVGILRRDEFLSYSIVNNSNPALMSGTIENNRLLVTPVGGQTGTALFTIRATDRYGATFDAVITVNLSNRPTATVELTPASPVATNAVLTATITDGDSLTYTYIWKTNGETKKKETTANLTSTFDLSVAGNGDTGQTITLEVIPNDGKLNGAKVTQTALVI